MKILEKLRGGQALTFEQFTEALGRVQKNNDFSLFIDMRFHYC